MDRRPDSSLAVLENIPPVLLTEKDEQAHYALLLTKARHKNYIDETDDSLINIALKYYRRHSSDSLLMQSLFYKATILYNSANYSQAIISATKAEDIARELNDNYWIARTCELISDIYTMTYYREEAVNYTLEASKYYLKSGKKTNSMYALLDLASCYANLGNYNRSIQLIDSIKNIAYKDHPIDSTFIACCIKSSITLYLWTGEYHKSKYAFENLSKFKTNINLTATDYARITEIYLNLGEKDSTEKYLNITLNKDQRLLDKISVQSLLLNYHKKTHNYKKALQYSDSIFALQDSTVHQALKQSVITAQRDLFRIQTNIDRKKVKRFRAYIFTGILFAIIIFSFGTAYHKLRIRLKNVEIDRKMNEVFILSEQNKYHKDINDTLKNNLTVQSKKISQLTDDLTSQQDKSNRMKSLVEIYFRINGILLMYYAMNFLKKELLIKHEHQ
jgi:hypothetical protein